MYEKDFGEWIVPTSWEEVTLSQFTQLMKKEKEATDIRDIITIVTNKDKDEVNRLPAEFAESMMARLSFMRKEPQFEAKNEVLIDGCTYSINVIDKMKFGEYVDVSTAMQADPYDYASFLGILARKQGEEYDDEFVGNKLDERIRMFASQPITSVLPLAAFFLSLFMASKKCSRPSLTEGKRQASQLAQSLQRSLLSGACRGRSLTWRMKAWWKLKNYKKRISRL